VLFILSVDVLIDVDQQTEKAAPIKPSTDGQSNTNKTINRQTKQHQYRHQQTDKTTPMKTSTDRQDNTNKNISRQTKQHQ
jgi:predicted RNA binding protein YcfA (HicA-like mRNA interferase family)